VGESEPRSVESIPKEEVESLNAHGPYTMAVWSAGDIHVGNEEGLQGRSAYFTRRIRETILENFTHEEIESLSIVDVGCNDGWVLHELSDLPFAQMVGIEPREKNIAKGRKVREVLGLENRVEYRLGDVESLGDECFDVVLCAGVLYHVESIPTALRQLRRICRRMLFIESRCMSSGHMTKALQHEIEMRDLVYQYKEKRCGLTAQKFESSYHDGSAREYSVVNVPTADSLYMYLDLVGFDRIDVVADPESYRADVWGKKRPLGGVCMAAFLSEEKSDAVQADDSSMTSREEAWIREYEGGLARTVLSKDLVEPLYQYFCQGEFSVRLLTGALMVFLYLRTPAWLSARIGSLIGSQDKYELEIIKNLRYSPSDKLSLEYAKLLYAERDYQRALPVLRSVTTKVNSDWRAVYRSFWLLFLTHKELGSVDEAERYKSLCLNCNPSYPQDEE
jgi:ubiquinone/menaquinone biosynthesis C-methylase UbiE